MLFIPAEPKSAFPANAEEKVACRRWRVLPRHAGKRRCQYLYYSWFFYGILDRRVYQPASGQLVRSLWRQPA